LVTACGGKTKTPEIFLSLRVFLPSFFTPPNWQPFPSVPKVVLFLRAEKKGNQSKKKQPKKTEK